MPTRTIEREDVFRAVDEAMGDLSVSGVETFDPGETTDETRLFGAGGVLDSLGLVHLIVLLEARLDERFGIAVTLADERALSERKSPFRTVGSLTDYALKRLTS